MIVIAPGTANTPTQSRANAGTDLRCSIPDHG
ncbi:hypothetical protein A8926_3386 [Saccharopolyspora spinosa]|uniref:Uncharacterized protein n=1 Tax=Saccharopolyspora spinosa TaxID=60894 RepID=A0A2N3XYE8_SACSN|nr:hypothetical protein A8926_3386 [Saccharopolyspora spinosa]